MRDRIILIKFHNFVRLAIKMFEFLVGEIGRKETPTATVKIDMKYCKK